MDQRGICKEPSKSDDFPPWLSLQRGTLKSDIAKFHFRVSDSVKDVQP